MRIPSFKNEELRLAALHRLNLINGESDADLDYLVTSLTEKLHYPVGFVSLVDRDHQWFKSIHGLDVRKAPRSTGFCDHTIRDDIPLVVEDALLDRRFGTNPFVAGPPHVRAYVGIPIRTAEGHRVGTVCVADFKPRTVTESDTATLSHFASVIERLIARNGLPQRGTDTETSSHPSTGSQAETLERYRRLESVLAAGHWELDMSTGNSLLSQGLIDLHEVDDQIESPSLSIASRYPENERKRIAQYMKLAWDVGRPFDMKSYFLDSVGRPRQVRIRGERVDDKSGSARIVGVVHDISGTHETEIRLNSAISIDPVSLASNSQAFEKDLADHIEGAPGEQFAVISIGIPDIVTVRQSHGMSMMDSMLRDVATVLRTDLTVGEMLGRTSYEGFSIRTAGFASPEHLRKRCRQLLKRLNVEVAILRRRMDINPECSVAIYPQDGPTVERLLRSADLALRVAYGDPQSDVVFFDPAMLDNFEIRENAADFLQTAVDEQRLLPYFQPIIRLSNGQLSGFEALVRVAMPDGSISVPSQFWPALLDPNTSRKVGFIMRDAVIGQMVQWRDRYGLTPQISLNAGWSDLSNGGMHADLVSMLRSRNLDPSQLKIEVTENVMLSDPATRVDANLKSLRAQGILISLDDFGTGYGSLISLLSLPTDEVKIDRNFVGTLEQRAESRAITGSIIELAGKMGITTVSEGIETPAQLAFVRSRGSTHGQGFLLGAPMTADDAASLLQRGKVDIDAHTDLSPAAQDIYNKE